MSEKVVCYNKLVDAYKFSNPECSHSLAQQKAKAYYDSIKNKADFNQLVDSKISEWKRAGFKRRVDNSSFFLPGVRVQKTTESTESDVETRSPQQKEVTAPLLPQAPEDAVP